jgi:tetratricopeptide (TPR) repeat protein
MSEDHPSAEDFDQFLRGASRATQLAGNAQVMRHLLSGCVSCRDLLRSVDGSGGRLAYLLQPTVERSQSEESFPNPVLSEGGYDYNRAFAMAEESVSAFLTPDPCLAEVSAPALLAGLLELPKSEQIERVSAFGPYATPVVVRELIDRSHALRYQSPEEMLHLAKLASIAAEGCTAVFAGSELRLADLRARAWGAYGNALRVGSRPHEADAAFATAQEYRQRGTNDPALRAWLLERITPLLIFQGHLNKALEVCEEAIQIYQDLEETHLLSVVLIQKAIVALYSGESELAIRTLNQAIPLIDQEEDPHLLLAACHNLIRCYMDLDRPDQALTLYNETRELHQEFSDPLIRLRVTWQEALLLRDLGHLRAAETALIHARKGYMEKELPYEVALVSLDLASVYVKLGLVQEVKRTVITTVPIFHALRVKVEILAALLQLQKVADQEQQALELIRSLDSRIKALPRKPAA